MRGLQVWSEGRKRRVGAALKGLPWVARGGKQGKGAAAAAAAARLGGGGTEILLGDLGLGVGGRVVLLIILKKCINSIVLHFN